MTVIPRRTLLAGAGIAAATAFIPRTQAAAASAPTLITVPPGQPLTYGVLGDSITGRGSFASDPSLTWTALLQARLAQTWTVTRVNGTTHTDAQDLTCLGTVDTVPSGCNLVVVGLGTNDCREMTGSSYTYSPTQTYNSAGTLFAEVAAANPAAVIVSLGVWGDTTVQWTMSGSTTPVSRVARWDALIGEQVAKNGGITVPAADLYGYSPNRLPAGVAAFGGYTTDGFHPNDAGHAALYARVASWLRLP
ncbi:acyl-CoA thioesterase-1 [Streptacidiphilus sp. MAP12-33]|uniref:SGNH/GDSL hydrolase family protein n=1 Tax=Streptacidiphilus sp. MAP12-33 TaxID=3156266 RepID=UPI003518E296